MKPEYKSQAYHDGFEHHEQGEPRTANPFGNGTWDRDEWFKGYDEAVEAQS